MSATLEQRSRSTFLARRIETALWAADAALDRAGRLINNPNDADGRQAITDLIEAASAVVGSIALAEMAADDEQGT